MSISSWTQDVRYGVRLLVTNPAFSLVAILSLALGIGANTAIFQLINAVRLRNLPVKNPRELAEVKIVGGNHGMGLNSTYGELTRPMWEEIRRDHPAFSEVFAWSPQQSAVGEGSSFEPVKSIAVSGEFFRVLGVEPLRGRLLGPEDEHACPDSAVVVSYAYWQSRLGRREIDDQTKLLVDGELRQVVGVTPPSFFGMVVGDRFDLARPQCRPKELARNIFEVSVMGRLRPGWTLERASAQLAGASAGIMSATEIQGYSSRAVENYRKFRLGAYPASAGVSALRQQYDSSLWLLLAITGLVLFIACANLANLMLARASAREREIALRIALGAARGRLVRQLLVESGLIALAGALMGIAMAEGLSRVLVASLATSNDTVKLSVGTDWRVLLFAATVATLTCILFGVAPALRASGADPVTAMKAGARGVTAGRERFAAQRLMVVAQISVSLVLLAGSLLFVRSFYNLMTFNPGLREEGVTLAFMGFPKANVPRDHIAEFKRELVDEVRALPGVKNAASTTQVPLLGGSWGHGIRIGTAEGNSAFTWVSPGYFETMGIPVLAGRGFNENDTGTSQHVAVVNQTFVRRYVPGGNPIGLSMRTSPEPNYPATDYQIIGIIPDTKYDRLRGGTPAMTFAPASQFPAFGPWMAMMIYSNQPPAVVIESVKRHIAAKHPEVVINASGVYQTWIRDGLVRDRLMATVSVFFGALAALLAMGGLYGVISYVVSRRRNEIGIRIAVGAGRGQVVGMVLREAGLMLVIGIVAGTGLALAAGRSANSLLFELKAYDPVTLGTAVAGLAVIGVVASFVPARRASKVDPMEALRCE